LYSSSDVHGFNLKLAGEEAIGERGNKWKRGPLWEIRTGEWTRSDSSQIKVILWKIQVQSP
jgi:hypothetical protein